MNGDITSRLRENFEWLRRDTECSDALRRGLFELLANEMKALTAPPSAAELKELLDSLDISDAESTAQLSLMLCRDTDKACHEVTCHKSAPKHISYMRSHASDRAFRIFSEQLADMSVTYGTDFKSICEDTYDRRVDACILPLESTDGGLLMTFRTLVLKYELSIFSACRVRQNDDSVLTLALLTPERHRCGEIAEFYLPSVPVGTLETLTRVTRVFDTSLLRAATVGSEYSDEYTIHAAAHIPQGLISAFDLCLEALYPSYTPLGNYSLLKNGKE